MSDTTEWLKERRRINGEATEGPWEWEPEIVTQAKFRPAKVSSVGWAGYPVNDAVEMPVPGTTADAIAIVDAHDTLPPLLSAMEKVLELHQETTHGECAICFECVNDDGYESDFSSVEWPCPTIRAIEGAINEWLHAE